MISLIKKNLLSIATALVILYLSLAQASTFSKVKVFDFPHLDKIVHICMYFGLMTVLRFENRRSMTSLKTVLLLAVIPFLYGILMEFLQSWLTTTRKGDIIDAFFNLAGIFIAVGSWYFYRLMTKRPVR